VLYFSFFCDFKFVSNVKIIPEIANISDKMQHCVAIFQVYTRSKDANLASLHFHI